MGTDIRRIREKNFIVSDGEEGDRTDRCALLLDRMEHLIDAMSPHQRDYHVVSRIDIYWYIQKLKEVEVLINRLLQNNNEILNRYLSSLCNDIQQRIDIDERFAKEYLNSFVRKTLRNKNHEPDQDKPPYP